MHPEIQPRLLAHHLGGLREPGTGHHDRSGGHEALPGQLGEGAIGAVAHPDVVDVRYQDARAG